MSNSSQSSALRRIQTLLDDSSFVETGAYVTARSTDFNMAPGDTPGDGVITGYGTITGNLVYVYSQDSAVMGGSVGEMHAKKISQLYSLAMKVGAPVIGLADCSGIRLQEGTDALNGFGQLYQCQAEASGVIPQIMAVFGVCGGGMAVSCAMADFVFMESERGRLFINSPNAIPGSDIAQCDTSSAKYQAAEVGIVDFTGNEAEILAGIRSLIHILPNNYRDDASHEICGDDLNRLTPGLQDMAGDAGAALAMIADNAFFMEVKKDYAPSMVTGFIRLNGSTVGCVANSLVRRDQQGEIIAEYDPVLTPGGCEKAAGFVSFCDAFHIPLLTMVNVRGYQACGCSEKKMAKAAGRLIFAFSSATVPKVTVVAGEAMGTAYLTMNSKSIGADVVYAWPQSSIGMMDAVSAAKIMYSTEIDESSDPASYINEKAKQYQELQSSAVSAARRGYVDDIIDARETRARVIAAFDMLFTKRVMRAGKKHGTV